MKRTLVIIAVLACALVACKKEEAFLRIHTEAVGGSQKTYLDGSNIICFFANDSVNINGKAVLMPQNGSEGTVHVDKANSYCAVYPYSIVTTPNAITPTTTSGINITLPRKQTYSTGNDGTANRQVIRMPMAAYCATEEGDIHFRNLCALMKVRVINSHNATLSVDSIVVVSSDSPLSGAGTIDVSTPSLSLTSTTADSKKVTLITSAAQGIAKDTEADFYVLVPPVSSTSNRFTVNVYGKLSGAVMSSTMTQTSGMADAKYTIARNQLGAVKYDVNSGNTTIIDVPVVGYGVFSVSATKKVNIAKRNLGYNRITSQWEFLGTQPYHGIGTIGTDKNYVYYFAYGTNTWNRGIGTLANYTDFYVGGNKDNDLTGTYAEYDCGWHNYIYDNLSGVTYLPHTWRIPTIGEWTFVLFNRPVVTNGTRYAKATVNGVYGLIIFPDNWVKNSHDVTIGNYDTPGVSWQSTTAIGEAGWATLEANGCVFLAAHGWHEAGRNPTTTSAASHGSAYSGIYAYSYTEEAARGTYNNSATNYGNLGNGAWIAAAHTGNGMYASASHYSGTFEPEGSVVSYLNFTGSGVATTGPTYRFEGRTVRLIHDID